MKISRYTATFNACVLKNKGDILYDVSGKNSQCRATGCGKVMSLF